MLQCQKASITKICAAIIFIFFEPFFPKNNIFGRCLQHMQEKSPTKITMLKNIITDDNHVEKKKSSKKLPTEDINSSINLKHKVVDIRLYSSCSET